MSQINPFTGSILQTTQVQRQQSADKDRQVRKVVEQAKNTALADDQLEHQVESSDKVTEVHEQQKQERRYKRPRSHAERPGRSGKDANDDAPPHLDLTA